MSSLNPERRHVLRLMAASLALGGLAGCDDDDDGRDHELPFVRQPEREIPGEPLFYASAALFDGFANGVLVTTRNGRPLKVEGNPQHPWSRGGTDVLAQASVLDFYDPYRSQTALFRARPSDWPSAIAMLTGQMGALRAARGRGLAVLTGPITSPSVLAQIASLQQAMPESRWYTHAAVERSAVYQGTDAAFGRALEPRWRFGDADVVVSLDGDFLDHGPHQVGVARDWIEARRGAAAQGRLLALHAVAASPNLTSAKADFAIAAAPDAIARLPERLLAAAPGEDPLGQWAARAGAALRQARGRGIVVAGSTQPPEVQAAVHRLNAQLGGAVFYTQPALPTGSGLGELVASMQRDEVQTLLMIDCNPVYTAPGDLGFAEALGRVALKIHAGGEADETAENADWHLPMAHPLESWGDARAFDGTVTLLQPTIAPLYESRTLSEILSLLDTGLPQRSDDLLRGYWQKRFTGDWQQALRDGFLPDTAFAPEAVSARAAPPASSAATAPGITLLFRPDPSVWDGTHASNAWLQELPKPLTKLVWENAVTIGPALARRLDLASGDVAEITLGTAHMQAPVWVLPGQADETATLYLGYGRAAQDMLATGIGYDAYQLRSDASPWQRDGATLRRAGRHERLAANQQQAEMVGTGFVQTRRVGAPPPPPAAEPPTLYPRWKDDGRAWGMVIDIDACIGCNACIIACQAENNIPVVGKEEFAKGRTLHWLRVDAYHAEQAEDPAAAFMPVPCMHCEQAPCEVGCPVEATLHDHEGLNLQVYNRCIGTRACSSYCPYKVRRFNYFDYAADVPASETLQRNPSVTTRARGVMEKCTYCVQRIAAARIDSDRTGLPIADGVVETACQNACPTRAIVFGDLDDATSRVRAAREEARNYALLGELNTRPRTTYLAKWGA